MAEVLPSGRGHSPRVQKQTVAKFSSPGTVTLTDALSTVLYLFGLHGINAPSPVEVVCRSANVPCPNTLRTMEHPAQSSQKQGPVTATNALLCVTYQSGLSGELAVLNAMVDRSQGPGAILRLIPKAPVVTFQRAGHVTVKAVTLPVRLAHSASGVNAPRTVGEVSRSE